jgi:uncharacterized protein YndB with AHSA1/START domain
VPEKSDPMIIDTSLREIVTTRLFAAPPERVFDAWSHAESLARWWGPKGFTTTTHVFDFRPGGEWNHTMHGPDGTDYPNRLVFDEIVLPARIVYTNRFAIDGVPTQFTQTVTFVGRGDDRTELTMRMVFHSAAERDAVANKYGAIEGAEQTLARLDQQLRSPVAGKPELRISRVFDAPKRLVFEAWSKAEHVSRWFTPAPLTTPSCEVDLRTGGAFRLTMRMPSGIEFPMDATFLEVVPNERIVFLANIHGGLHGGLQAHTTVTFSEANGRTTMAVHQVFSRESNETRGAQAGWTQTLEQLAQFLRR